MDYADYLKRRLEARDDSSDDVERARRIGEAAQRILRFSRDLVAYARPSSDVPGPVVLHEVIDKALVFCEHELEKSGVEVERRWQAEIPEYKQVCAREVSARRDNGHGGITLRAQGPRANDIW